MKKYIFIALIAIVCLATTSFVLAKEFITGYDVNNGCEQVKVEKGVYAPGVSLYFSECQNPMIGVTTKSNLVTSGNLTVGGETQAKRVIQGGTVTNATSTLTGPLTLTAAQVCNSSVITVNTAATTGSISVASIDVTMPATSTLFADCLDNTGDKIDFIFVNASPTAASTTEFVAGTGCEGMISGDTAAADTLAGGSSAKITLQRATDYLGVNGTADCIFYIEEWVAD